MLLAKLLGLAFGAGLLYMNPSNGFGWLLVILMVIALLGGIFPSFGRKEDRFVWGLFGRRTGGRVEMTTPLIRKGGN